MIAEREFAGRQCLGKRAAQEDSYAFSEIDGGEGAKGLLVVVADGMGGHAAGEFASDLAVRKFVAAFHRPGESIAARLATACDVANGAIADAIEDDPDRCEGMGTTLVAAAITAAGIEWISVGDSLLWLWRDGSLRRLNADHSFRPVLREMIERGELTEEQAAKSALRNRLRAALIGGEIALLDASPAPHPLSAGDVVLIASDGLMALSENAIADLLGASAEASAEDIATRLLRAVLDADKPKQDNATVALVKPPSLN
jgi:serine/threonine protein phosphatase PrpC